MVTAKTKAKSLPKPQKASAPRAPVKKAALAKKVAPPAATLKDKPAAVVKPSPASLVKAAKPVALKPKAAPAEKPKAKLIRDSFTMPKLEYAAIDELKQRAAKLARPTKKSELLRAGIKALSGLNDKALLAALQAVPTIKTGRPGKS